MKVSRRFQLTVQTVLFIAVYSDKKEVTCENISKEMKCNPVVIKNILNILCKNNFLTKGSSISNIRLKRNIKDITLWDIYKITDEVDINNIFCKLQVLLFQIYRNYYHQLSVKLWILWKTSYLQFQLILY